jgi:uncharacterized protein (TIGR04222 family)
MMGIGEEWKPVDWLLHNPIADLVGSHFLLLYGIVILVTVAACRSAVRRLDPTRSLAPPPVPEKPDPYAIAYLRGGENEVTRAAIFNLIQRGYLEAIDEETKLRAAPTHPDPQYLCPVERALFECFSGSNANRSWSARDIFESRLPSAITQQAAAVEEQLRREQLMMPPDALRMTNWICFRGEVVILGLGGYKLTVALMKGLPNVGFLILMGIVSLVLLSVICKTPRLTSRGQRYLERLQLAFSRLKTQPPVRSAGWAEPALLLLVCLFGVGALSETAYAYYPQTFAAAASSGGSCGGGCGGAGCGGGCGGCGGCGGG